MQRIAVIDFFGVIRVVGYALALLAAGVFGAMWWGSHWLPALRFGSTAMAGPLLVGLLVAWGAGLCRVLVRRMRFQSPQA